MEPIKFTRGERIIEFIESFLGIPEGTHVGEPFLLRHFQKKFILEVFDNPNPSGTSEAYLSIPRKNGKTSLIAAILIAFLAGPEAVKNSQIVSGAQTKEQAALIFDAAQKIINSSPLLEGLIIPTRSKNVLIGVELNVTYKAMSGEAKSAHGISPILAIIDEIGQVQGPKSEFVDAIQSSFGAYENSLFIAISTQSATDGDLFSLMLDDAESSGDKSIVSHVYTATNKKCDLMDKEAWEEANPALGQFLSEKKFTQMAEKADRMPSEENKFRRYNLNQRIESISSFIPPELWKSCGEIRVPEKGAVCYAGLDLSLTTDLTAFVMVFPKEKENIVVSHFFLPEENIRDREKDDKVPYKQWVKDGYMTLIPGRTIDQGFVIKHIMEAIKDYDLKVLAYDDWNISSFKRELERQEITLPLQDFRQGFKSMSPATKKLERTVINGELLHGNNPVLNMCITNTVLDIDPAGNVKPNKKKARGRIDGSVALIMALDVVDDDEIVEMTSPYDDPNFSYYN